MTVPNKSTFHDGNVTNTVTFAALDRFYAAQGPCPCCGAEWDNAFICVHADDCSLLDDDGDGED